MSSRNSLTSVWELLGFEPDCSSWSLLQTWASCWLHTALKQHCHSAQIMSKQDFRFLFLILDILMKTAPKLCSYIYKLARQRVMFWISSHSFLLCCLPAFTLLLQFLVSKECLSSPLAAAQEQQKSWALQWLLLGHSRESSWDAILPSVWPVSRL